MKIKNVFFTLGLILLCLSSCSNGDAEEKPLAKRTFVAYMMCDGLDSYIRNNINEILEASASVGDNSNILVFADYQSGNSVVYKIAKGKKEIVRDYGENIVNSDPSTMKEILRWCYSNYPAESYALAIGSHGTGWLFKNDSIATRGKNVKTAIGETCGNDRPINIPTFASVIKELPHLSYLLFDCCVMQNVEVAYEMRQYVDFIIGSPAEIPNNGAPYRKLLSALLGDSPQAIANIYYNTYINNDYGVPMSMVKTSELDNLAAVTREKLNLAYPDDVNTTGLIYYYTIRVEGCCESRLEMMYDMNDFMLKHLSSTDYQQWRAQYEKVVPVRLRCSRWEHTDALPEIDWDSFRVTDETFGGLSMFVPLRKYDNLKLPYNSDYKKLAWYRAIYE